MASALVQEYRRRYPTEASVLSDYQIIRRLVSGNDPKELLRLDSSFAQDYEYYNTLSTPSKYQPSAGEYASEAWGSFVRGAGQIISDIPKAAGIGYGAIAGTDPEDNWFYKAGNLVDRAVEAIPTVGAPSPHEELSQNFLASKLPSGIGTTIGFAATTMATMGAGGAAAGAARATTLGAKIAAKKAAQAGVKAASTTGSSARYLNAFKRAAPVLPAGAATGVTGQFEAARAAGADLDTAYKAAWKGGLVGMSEAIPFAGMFAKLERLTPGSTSLLKRVLVDMAPEAAEEALQELVQTWADNLIAQSHYDESRDIYEGLGEGAAIGGIAGAIFGGILTGMRRRGAEREAERLVAAWQAAADELAKQTSGTDNSPGKIESVKTAAEVAAGRQPPTIIPTGLPVDVTGEEATAGLTEGAEPTDKTVTPIDEAFPTLATGGPGGVDAGQNYAEFTEEEYEIARKIATEDDPETQARLAEDFLKGDKKQERTKLVARYAQTRHEQGDLDAVRDKVEAEAAEARRALQNEKPESTETVEYQLNKQQLGTLKRFVNEWKDGKDPQAFLKMIRWATSGDRKYHRYRFAAMRAMLYPEETAAPGTGPNTAAEALATNTELEQADALANDLINDVAGAGDRAKKWIEESVPVQREARKTLLSQRIEQLTRPPTGYQMAHEVPSRTMAYTASLPLNKKGGDKLVTALVKGTSDEDLIKEFPKLTQTELDDIRRILAFAELRGGESSPVVQRAVLHAVRKGWVSPAELERAREIGYAIYETLGNVQGLADLKKVVEKLMDARAEISPRMVAAIRELGRFPTGTESTTQTRIPEGPPDARPFSGVGGIVTVPGVDEQGRPLTDVEIERLAEEAIHARGQSLYDYYVQKQQARKKAVDPEIQAEYAALVETFGKEEADKRILKRIRDVAEAERIVAEGHRKRVAKAAAASVRAGLSPTRELDVLTGSLDADVSLDPDVKANVKGQPRIIIDFLKNVRGGNFEAAENQLATVVQLIENSTGQTIDWADNNVRLAFLRSIESQLAAKPVNFNKYGLQSDFEYTFEEFKNLKKNEGKKEEDLRTRHDKALAKAIKDGKKLREATVRDLKKRKKDLHNDYTSAGTRKKRTEASKEARQGYLTDNEVEELAKRIMPGTNLPKQDEKTHDFIPEDAEEVVKRVRVSQESGGPERSISVQERLYIRSQAAALHSQVEAGNERDRSKFAKDVSRRAKENIDVTQERDSLKEKFFQSVESYFGILRQLAGGRRHLARLNNAARTKVPWWPIPALGMPNVEFVNQHEPVNKYQADEWWASRLFVDSGNDARHNMDALATVGADILAYLPDDVRARLPKFVLELFGEPKLKKETTDHAERYTASGKLAEYAKELTKMVAKYQADTAALADIHERLRNAGPYEGTTIAYEQRVELHRKQQEIREARKNAREEIYSKAAAAQGEVGWAFEVIRNKMDPGERLNLPVSSALAEERNKLTRKIGQLNRKKAGRLRRKPGSKTDDIDTELKSLRDRKAVIVANLDLFRSAKGAEKLDAMIELRELTTERDQHREDHREAKARLQKLKQEFEEIQTYYARVILEDTAARKRMEGVTDKERIAEEELQQKLYLKETAWLSKESQTLYNDIQNAKADIYRSRTKLEKINRRIENHPEAGTPIGETITIEGITLHEDIEKIEGVDLSGDRMALLDQQYEEVFRLYQIAANLFTSGKGYDHYVTQADVLQRARPDLLTRRRKYLDARKEIKDPTSPSNRPSMIEKMNRESLVWLTEVYGKEALEELGDLGYTTDVVTLAKNEKGTTVIDRLDNGLMSIPVYEVRHILAKKVPYNGKIDDLPKKEQDQLRIDRKLRRKKFNEQTASLHANTERISLLRDARNARPQAVVTSTDLSRKAVGSALDEAEETVRYRTLPVGEDPHHDRLRQRAKDRYGMDAVSAEMDSPVWMSAERASVDPMSMLLTQAVAAKDWETAGLLMTHGWRGSKLSQNITTRIGFFFVPNRDGGTGGRIVALSMRADKNHKADAAEKPYRFLVSLGSLPGYERNNQIELETLTELGFTPFASAQVWPGVVHYAAFYQDRDAFDGHWGDADETANYLTRASSAYRDAFFPTSFGTSPSRAPTRGAVDEETSVLDSLMEQREAFREALEQARQEMEESGDYLPSPSASDDPHSIEEETEDEFTSEPEAYTDGPTDAEALGTLLGEDTDEDQRRELNAIHVDLSTDIGGMLLAVFNEGQRGTLDYFAGLPGPTTSAREQDLTNDLAAAIDRATGLAMDRIMTALREGSSNNLHRAANELMLIANVNALRIVDQGNGPANLSDHPETRAEQIKNLAAQNVRTAFRMALTNATDGGRIFAPPQTVAARFRQDWPTVHETLATEVDTAANPEYNRYSFRNVHIGTIGSPRINLNTDTPSVGAPPIEAVFHPEHAKLAFDFVETSLDSANRTSPETARRYTGKQKAQITEWLTTSSKDEGTYQVIKKLLRRAENSSTTHALLSILKTLAVKGRLAVDIEVIDDPNIDYKGRYFIETNKVSINLAHHYAGDKRSKTQETYGHGMGDLVRTVSEELFHAATADMVFRYMGGGKDANELMVGVVDSLKTIHNAMRDADRLGLFVINDYASEAHALAEFMINVMQQKALQAALESSAGIKTVRGEVKVPKKDSILASILQAIRKLFETLINTLRVRVTRPDGSRFETPWATLSKRTALMEINGRTIIKTRETLLDDIVSDIFNVTSQANMANKLVDPELVQKLRERGFEPDYLDRPVPPTVKRAGGVFVASPEAAYQATSDAMSLVALNNDLKETLTNALSEAKRLGFLPPTVTLDEFINTNLKPFVTFTPDESNMAIQKELVEKQYSPLNDVENITEANLEDTTGLPMYHKRRAAYYSKLISYLNNRYRRITKILPKLEESAKASQTRTAKLYADSENLGAINDYVVEQMSKALRLYQGIPVKHDAVSLLGNMGPIWTVLGRQDVTNDEVAKALKTISNKVGDFMGTIEAMMGSSPTTLSRATAFELINLLRGNTGRKSDWIRNDSVVTGILINFIQKNHEVTDALYIRRLPARQAAKKAIAAAFNNNPDAHGIAESIAKKGGVYRQVGAILERIRANQAANKAKQKELNQAKRFLKIYPVTMNKLSQGRTQSQDFLGYDPGFAVRIFTDDDGIIIRRKTMGDLVPTVGSQYFVPVRPDLPDSQVLTKYSLKTVSRLDARTFEEMGDHYKKIREWLNDNPDGRADVRRELERTLESLARFIAAGTSGEYANKVLIPAIASMPELLRATGSPAARVLAERLVQLSSHHRKTIETPYVRDWTVALNDAMQSSGVDSKGTFNMLFVDPAFGWLENRRDLLESNKNRTESELDNIAVSYMVSHLMGDAQLKKDYFDAKPEFVLYLRKYLHENIRINRFLRKHMQDLNLKVMSSDVGGQFFRIPVGHTAWHMARSFNDETVRLIESKAVHDAFAEVELKNEANRLAIEPYTSRLLKQPMVEMYIGDGTATGGVSRMQLYAAIDGRFAANGMWDGFTVPIATKPGMSTIHTPITKDSKSYSMYDPDVVALAFERSGGSLVRALELLYDSHVPVGKEAEFEPKAEFVVGAIMAINNKFRIFREAVSESAVTRTSTVFANTGFMRHEREMNWPPELLRYAMYDETTARAMIQSMSVGATLGWQGHEAFALLDSALAEMKTKASQAGDLRSGRITIEDQDKRREIFAAEKHANTLERMKRELEEVLRRYDEFNHDPRHGLAAINTMANMSTQSVRTVMPDFGTHLSSFLRTYGLQAGLKEMPVLGGGLLREALGTLTQFLGMEANMSADEAEMLRMINEYGPMDADSITTFRQKTLMVTHSNAKSKIFRHVRNALNYRLGYRANDPARAYVGLTPLSVYTMWNQWAHRAGIRAAFRRWKYVQKEFQKYVTANPDAVNPDVITTYDTLRSKGYFDRWTKREYDFFYNALRQSGIRPEAAADRANRGMDPLSVADKTALMSLSAREHTLEAGIDTRPGYLLGSKAQYLTPLITWPLSQMNSLIKGVTGSGYNDASAKEITKGMIRLVVGLPFPILLLALRELWDEEVIGKKANSLGTDMLFSEAGHLALADAVSSTGYLGYAGDLINLMANRDTARPLSMDARLFAVNSVRSLAQALSKSVSRRTLDWETTWRPIIQATGGHAFLQDFDIVFNLADVDNAERRLVRRINTNNLLRAAGRQVPEVDVSTFSGASSATGDPMQPHVSKMQLAAYANDAAGFREAYRNAVTTARKIGRAEPSRTIYRKFQSRHPYKSVFQRMPDEIGLAKLRRALGDKANDIDNAVRNFEFFETQIKPAAPSKKLPTNKRFGENPYETVTYPSFNPQKQVRTMEEWRQMATANAMAF